MRWIRESLDKTQKQAEKELKIPSTRLQRNELGGSDPKAHTLLAYAKRWHVDLTWLVTGEGWPWRTDKAENIAEDKQQKMSHVIWGGHGNTGPVRGLLPLQVVRVRGAELVAVEIDVPNPGEQVAKGDYAIVSRKLDLSHMKRPSVLCLIREGGVLSVRRLRTLPRGQIDITDGLGLSHKTITLNKWPTRMHVVGLVVALVRPTLEDR